MDVHQIKYREKLASHLIKNLARRRMTASFAPTAAQAREEIIAMIPDGRHGQPLRLHVPGGDGPVGGPGSKDRRGNHRSLCPGVTPEEASALMRRGLLADFMITSSNALTMDGKLVNLDATGNRVAAMCFGPDKVILVVGMNKVVPDLDTAMARVKHLAAPINAIRLNRETPCAETSQCVDCKSPARLCNMWSIIEGHRFENRIHVKLVGEDLGY